MPTQIRTVAAAAAVALLASASPLAAGAAATAASAPATLAPTTARALAAAPTAGTYKACANKKTGAIRLVLKGKPCKRSERRLSLGSGPGPAGAPGATGPVGPSGAPGATGAAGAPGLGVATYGESSLLSTPVSTTPTVVATTDGLSAPDSSGGTWFGALSFPGNGALAAQASVQVVTDVATGTLTCHVQSDRGSGFIDVFRSTASGTDTTMRFTVPFVDSAVNGPVTEHFRVVCQTDVGQRSVTNARILVHGTFVPYSS